MKERKLMNSVGIVITKCFVCEKDVDIGITIKGKFICKECSLSLRFTY